jgi:hypothetical protein
MILRAAIIVLVLFLAGCTSSKRNCEASLDCLKTAIKNCEEVRYEYATPLGSRTAETIKASEICQLTVVDSDSKGNRIDGKNCFFNMPVTTNFTREQFPPTPVTPFDLCDYANRTFNIS